MKKWIIRLTVSFIGLVGLAVAAIIISGFTTRLAGEETLANGIKRNSAVYVKMQDGT